MGHRGQNARLFFRILKEVKDSSCSGKQQFSKHTERRMGIFFPDKSSVSFIYPFISIILSTSAFCSTPVVHRVEARGMGKTARRNFSLCFNLLESELY